MSTEFEQENDETTAMEEQEDTLSLTDSAEGEEEMSTNEDLSISQLELTDSPKVAEKGSANDEKKWYSLRVISGKENKIRERILNEVELNGWQHIVTQVVIPSEKVYKIRNGKKVLMDRNILPGYIIVEAVASKLNGEIAKAINDTPNVIHFLGKEKPIPMALAEANRLLGRVDDSTELGEVLSEPFIVGETVNVIDGPFSNFVGDIQEVNEDKKKLKVIVKIFGRGTEVELNFLQVEKIHK